MRNRKFKSYLITNIPETDWKRFKRWTAMQEFNNLNDAINNLIKLAGSNSLRDYTDGVRREVVEHKT